LSILGFRVYNLAYLTDVKAIPEEEMTKLQDLDVLVISALQLEPEHFSHLTLRQALALIERIKPRRAYLTHMSHRIGLHEELQQSLPPNVFAAYDGLLVRAASG
jgi:phosphoribosyl 1,2-cyclic phosphate phosphodiesterase